MFATLLLVIVCLVCLGRSNVSGLIHHLTIDSDSRELFKIETFGFNKGGVMDLSINDMKLDHPIGETVEETEKEKLTEFQVGFVMRKSNSESEAQQDLQNMTEQNLCLFDAVEEDDVIIDLSKDSMWKHANHVIHSIGSEEETGLYTLLFARCKPAGTDHSVSFMLDVTFMNPGNDAPGKTDGNWDYLSAGDQPLPMMYMIFFGLFFIAFLMWLAVLRRDPLVYGTIHKIHYLMAVLVVLKCCTLLTESVRYHMVSSSGITGGFLNTIYYAFSTMRGIMLFIVILLIGSGWSILRGFLHDREKKIVVVVLFTQVLNNIAIVVLEETAPGSIQWTEWRDIMHIVDLACCAAIIFPILWSIKHLGTAVEADAKDNKSQLSLVKLKLFRSFYIMVICYIYFTRIVVFLVAATVPFHLMWLGAFCSEFAALVFYIATGYKFQPIIDNPYLAVNVIDDDGEHTYNIDREFGEMDSDDEGDKNKVELGSMRAKNPMIEV